MLVGTLEEISFRFPRKHCEPETIRINLSYNTMMNRMIQNNAKGVMADLTAAFGAIVKRNAASNSSVSRRDNVSKHLIEFVEFHSASNCVLSIAKCSFARNAANIRRNPSTTRIIQTTNENENNKKNEHALPSFLIVEKYWKNKSCFFFFF